MQAIKSISIPKPCHEKWNDMTPVEQGRHCMQCSKTVTDFTVMTNTEIINYFARNGNVCGRFGKTQLAGLNNYLNVEEKSVFSWKQLTIAAAVTGLFATINADAQRTVGKVKVLEAVSNMQKNNEELLFKDTVTRTVRGLIKSADDGLPLPGASVRVLNSNIGTVVGVNGEYTLEVPVNRDTLEVKFIGFMPQKILLDTIKATSCNATLSLREDLELRSAVAGGIIVIRQSFFSKMWYNIKHLFTK